MAEFADEEIDLGELGKFKHSFLEEAMKLFPCPVETNYVERLENYDRRINDLGNIRIGFSCKLSKLHNNIMNLEDNIEKRDKLINDFRKYFEIFPTRQGKVHYHKRH